MEALIAPLIVQFNPHASGFRSSSGIFGEQLDAFLITGTLLKFTKAFYPDEVWRRSDVEEKHDLCITGRVLTASEMQQTRNTRSFCSCIKETPFPPFAKGPLLDQSNAAYHV